VFRDVKYNEPGSYDSATGYYTVPTPGVYYFIASTGADNANSGVQFSLYVDDTQIDISYAYNPASNEMSSVHGVVHLQAGQRVWVRSNGDTAYWPTVSAFTGFLLSPDP
jgi:hypothetical protein